MVTVRFQIETWKLKIISRCRFELNSWSLCNSSVAAPIAQLHIHHNANTLYMFSCIVRVAYNRDSNSSSIPVHNEPIKIYNVAVRIQNTMTVYTLHV